MGHRDYYCLSRNRIHCFLFIFPSDLNNEPVRNTYCGLSWTFDPADRRTNSPWTDLSRHRQNADLTPIYLDPGFTSFKGNGKYLFSQKLVIGNNPYWFASYRYYNNPVSSGSEISFKKQYPNKANYKENKKFISEGHAVLESFCEHNVFSWKDYSKSSVLMYLSAESGRITIMFCPEFSLRFATFKAAATAAPEEIPARIPSSLARRLEISNAS